MGTPKQPEKVKLFAGVIFNGRAPMKEVESALAAAFGPADHVSAQLPFDLTDYYGREMGGPLLKKLYSFSRLIEQDGLAEAKLASDAIEKAYSHEGSRTVNIDPGYIALSRIVLASTKEFYHRIYIGRGIFAELTLYYKDNRFNPLPWTFPDFRCERYVPFFTAARALYRDELKKKDID